MIVVVTWTAFGNLRSVSKGALSREYVRDALGRIVGESDESGKITWFGYDGMHRVIRDRSASGQGLDYTIDGAGPDQHYLRLNEDNSEVYYFHQGRLGSVIGISELSEPAGPLSIVEWMHYTAYGEMTLTTVLGEPLSESLMGNGFGFQGQQLGPEAQEIQGDIVNAAALTNSAWAFLPGKAAPAPNPNVSGNVPKGGGPNTVADASPDGMMIPVDAALSAGPENQSTWGSKGGAGYFEGDTKRTRKGTSSFRGYE